ncbi:MAG: phosphatase PAP2 family protein [Chloroflexia bacterium]|nr:phosphatase PAP2 family protein [Chloroflexia bacterium]
MPRTRTVSLEPLREVGIIAVATFLYFFVRGLVDGRVADAVGHARWLVDLERQLGVFWEPAIQRWTLANEALVRAANAVYIYGHWPVVIATLTWLLIAHREHFPLYRTALLVSGAIGLVCFVTVPMAPPRFLGDLGFVDTVTLHSEAYRVLQPPSLVNQYAAMPSLHVGWNLLMGIAIVTLAGHWAWKAFGVAMPLAMSAATLMTANHYLIDGLAGSLIALIGLAAARRMSGPGSKPVASGSVLNPQSSVLRPAAHSRRGGA